MKQAKQEAQLAIDEYRSEKEAEFNAATAKMEVSDESTVLLKQTELEIEQMKSNFNANKQVCAPRPAWRALPSSTALFLSPSLFSL